jgi:IMP cyclohydrolase
MNERLQTYAGYVKYNNLITYVSEYKVLKGVMLSTYGEQWENRSFHFFSYRQED